MHARGTSVSDATRASRMNGESMGPIRALSRGLELLIELNRRKRAAINTLASALGLPRTTTYRILETLRLAGYVERDARDDCYRPTILVRALSEGFDAEALLAHLAKPHLVRLGAQLLWPVAIAVPAGTVMTVRATSRSPLAIEHFGVGARLPMLVSAAGRAYLAFCGPAQRDALLDLLAHSSLAEDRLARSRSELEHLLGETRAQGYAIAQRVQRTAHEHPAQETSLAIALQSTDQLLVTLSVRFAPATLATRTAVEQFLPKMRETAAAILRDLSGQAPA